MINFIKSRRSCRNYQDKPVTQEQLYEIVECGLMAPSGMNTQEVKFCVISNSDVLNTLEELAGRPFFYKAPALIVVYSDPDNRYAAHDGSCAMSQMYLAAHALGLGSVWINQLKDFVLDPKFDDVMTQLNLKGKTIVGSLAVGYINGEPREKTIKENRVTYVD